MCYRAYKKGGDGLKINKEKFLTICEQLYNDDEYNRAIGTMAVTKDKQTYAENLIKVLKIEQSVLNGIQE